MMKAAAEVLVFGFVGASLFIAIVFGLSTVRRDGYQDGYQQCQGEKDE
jgi:hypothetical protein